MTRRYDKSKQPYPIHGNHKPHEENSQRVKKDTNDEHANNLADSNDAGPRDWRKSTVERSDRGRNGLIYQNGKDRVD